MPDTRICWFFPVPGENAWPAEVRALVSAVRERLGFVPNVFRAMAFRPERMLAWWNHYSRLKEPTENLGEVERELIAVVVSSLNSCPYCLASHGAALRIASGDPTLTERVSANWRHAGLSELHRALCTYAEKLTLDPHTVDESDLQALAAAGLTPEEVWDAAEVTAMFNFTNRLALATGLKPNAEYFAAGR